MTPTELLESKHVHSMNSAAIVLDLLDGQGRPRRDLVHKLIRSGAIRLVDPDQPVTRWTISSAELRRYAAEGPRKGADIVPIRSDGAA
jgi:hypothetical protein